MHIEIFSDMVCPWCRIGKKNLKDALAKWHKEVVTLEFKAYQLDPTLPEEGTSFLEAMGKKVGGTSKFQGMLDQVTQAGAAVGLTFHFDKVEKMANTKLAHRLVSLISLAEQDAMVDAIMKAYFEEGQDITKLEVLLQLASSLGHEVEPLEAQLEEGGGEESVKADDELARKFGITGVPFFVFNRRFALSGAYPAEQFIQVLDQALEESKNPNAD